MPARRRRRSKSSGSHIHEVCITESDGIQTTLYHPTPSTNNYGIGSVQLVARSVARSIAQTFLPSPASVNQSYYQYQIYDTLQGLSSYLRSLLTTASVLSTMGIGSETATPIAAALIWAFRDGLGMIVGLLFGGAKSTAFKGYVLQYRLFADVMNDLGMIVDIALPFCDPKYYNAGYAISTSCKAICGVAAGATRGSILMR